MKLLTLNTHSLIEPDYEAKREIFVKFIAAEQPEVFALQEVNQTAAAPLLGDAPAGYYSCPGNRVPLKADNHAAAVARMLEERGVHYYWSWLPAKVGYDIYDEGAAAKKRIDQIWCSKAVPVKSSRVVFNGVQEPQVSDHAGILIEL